MVNNYDSYSYIPKLIHDDDEVRRNINDQINFVNILSYLIIRFKFAVNVVSVSISSGFSFSISNIVLESAVNLS